MKALANHVRDKLKEAGASILGVEGEDVGEWVLVDAGDIVVHVMQPAVRAYYSDGQVKVRAAVAHGAVGVLSLTTDESDKLFAWPRLVE